MRSLLELTVDVVTIESSLCGADWFFNVPEIDHIIAFLCYVSKGVLANHADEQNDIA